MVAEGPPPEIKSPLAVDEHGDWAYAIQAKVMVDESLSDAAKMRYCKLVCFESLRDGWGYGTRRPRVELLELAELSRAGYISLKADPGGGHTVFLKWTEV